MYKNKLRTGDLDNFTAAQVEQMKQTCKERKTEIEKLYQMANNISF